MKILLLAGTSEARALAGLLAEAPDIEATASLAGVTRAPANLALPTRHGGFGGEILQEKYLKNNGFDAVIDATHPFASQISQRTARICTRLSLPCLHLLRPPWRVGRGDDWTEIASATAAADHIPPGATVFLATGRQTLPEFANLSDRRLICRQIDAPDAPFPYEGGEYLIGKPPFSLEDEVALFQACGVDWLVVKNAGGKLSRSKLDAARALGLPVLMIRRPEPPPGLIVDNVAAAMGWVRAQCG